MKRIFLACLVALPMAVQAFPGADLWPILARRRAEADDFVSTWRTTADTETITVPTRSGFAYDCTVDWGDGTVESLSGYDDAKWTHEYATAGDYNVTISGTFEKIYFNDGGDRLKLIAIPNLGSVGWKSFYLAFYGCANLLSVAGGDTSLVDSFGYAFRGCSSLVTLDSSGWNTSSVVSFYLAFYGCSSVITLDTSGWNTSSVETFAAAFRDCSSLTSYMPPAKFWDRVPAVPEHTECFYEATNIVNYADIPADWK